jgi:signal transduction histidine kinase
MTTDRHFPSFWSLHLAGWAALGLAMWLGALAHTDMPGRTLVGKLIFAVLGGLLTLGLRPFYRTLHEQDVSIPRLIAVSAVCSYALSVVWSILHRGSTDLLWEWVDGETLTLLSFSGLISGALFYTFIPMAWSVLYFGVKYYQDAQAERERALAAEGLAHQAQLQALRYQLNPHFLFNTLNAISTLIVERHNRDAERMVARLSDFLRVTLEAESAVEVPLVDELDFARRYLDIEQIRFGDRLTVEEDVEVEALSARVPPLLLQPLVENAVRHGIMPRENGGTLTIEARQVGERLLLRVADDGPGPPDETDPAEGTGIGLSNTKARLDALYGDNYDLALQRADGGGCVVRIEMPFRRADASSLSPDPDAANLDVSFLSTSPSRTVS